MLESFKIAYEVRGLDSLRELPASSVDSPDEGINLMRSTGGAGSSRCANASRRQEIPVLTWTAAVVIKSLGCSRVSRAGGGRICLPLFERLRQSRFPRRLSGAFTAGRTHAIQIATQADD